MPVWILSGICLGTNRLTMNHTHVLFSVLDCGTVGMLSQLHVEHTTKMHASERWVPFARLANFVELLSKEGA